jgi:hypothetical protein
MFVVSQCTDTCKSLPVYSRTVPLLCFFMYTKEKKLEIQIPTKLFAIQILFSPKHVPRSKSLIVKVFFFRFSYCSILYSPLILIFIRPVGIFFFLFLFRPSMCVVSSSLLVFLKVKIKVNYYLVLFYM